ncbi:MAG: RsmG family class I SAM-dependent methyltransferase [Acidimicrobiales bacterium]
MDRSGPPPCAVGRTGRGGPGGTGADGLLLDLGSGAGLPGLGLALLWPDSRWLLVDGRVRSTRFLAGAVRRLGLGDRVSVVGGRAEVIAHDPHHRAAMELVVARSVSSPAVVAECAAGFLRPGGMLVVSEPPDASELRWEAGALARLGMGPVRTVESSGGFHFTVVEQQEACPGRYPRRTGIPSKRPLF